MNIKRGDIWLVDLGEYDGTSRQYGIRPVVVISNNKANEHSPVIHIVPLTSKTKNKLPTHIDITINVKGINKTSIVLAEQVTLIDRNILYKKVGEVDEKLLNKLDVCLMIQFGVYDKVKAMKQENKDLKQNLELARC